jgi:hypothetical protein
MRVLLLRIAAALPLVLVALDALAQGGRSP